MRRHTSQSLWFRPTWTCLPPPSGCVSPCGALSHAPRLAGLPTLAAILQGRVLSDSQERIKTHAEAYQQRRVVAHWEIFVLVGRH